MSDILQKLVEEDFGIEGRGKWYHSSDHDSLVVNAEEQTWFWNSRGLRGGTIDYLVHVRGMKKEDARHFLDNYFGAFTKTEGKVIFSLPHEALVNIMWANGAKNRDYWYSRKLTDNTIDRYKLGYYDGWSLVPIYEDNEFVNFQCRRDEPKKAAHYWYKTGKVYLFNDTVLPFTKVIYITEGLVDAILLTQEGFPSVSAGGVNTWQQGWFNKFTNIPTIYYFEDNDEAGRIGSRAVCNSLGLGRVKIVTFPDKENKYDAGDFFKDGGTKEDLKEYIQKNAKFLFELESNHEKKFQLRNTRKEYSWKR